MRRLASVLLVAPLFACTSVGPGDVNVTRKAADVEHCKPIGAVQTIPPYAFPGDDLKQIRAKTLAVGADTVLLNASREIVAGVAYRCRTT